MFSSICRVRQRVKPLSKINAQQSLFYFSFLQHLERPYSELDCMRQAVLYPFVCEIEKFLSTLSLQMGKGRAENGWWIWCASVSQAGPAPKGDKCISQQSSSREKRRGRNSDSSHFKESSPQTLAQTKGNIHQNVSTDWQLQVLQVRAFCNYPTHERVRHQFWLISALSEVSHTVLVWVTARNKWTYFPLLKESLWIQDVNLEYFCSLAVHLREIQPLTFQ